ncbi:MAG: DUF3090 domain-containing protein [Chloroflexi bacterium]|nr:DUF3090 domain-containing protein [Chloroflexota bacterium]MDK1044212.1 DUF3090 domain-containing protein [Anaerolineales bacterium]MCH8876898.1 DUF3090 domain-containing protein [Chloroflexota bacterium]MCI0772174.1 DUF3090 domain-containing protein [Chloroflexota bacterium]MCI0805826.1 DUF3090 domain-containing protein [Chloroflexota bacterium]
MELELNPVSRITTGAVGPPGKRVFYLQARKDRELVTLIIEKHQVQSLAVGLEEFLDELSDRLPDLPEASADYNQDEMELEQPLDPIFRVGQIGLSYDEESDRLVLVARQLDSEGQGSEVVRFWCTRSQLRAMCLWGIEVASQGRPICGNCGEPKDPEGHFCPKSNGHKI